MKLQFVSKDWFYFTDWSFEVTIWLKIYETLALKH